MNTSTNETHRIPGQVDQKNIDNLWAQKPKSFMEKLHLALEYQVSAMAAAMVRAVDGDLSKLDINWCPERRSSYAQHRSQDPWRKLLACLSGAKKQDAMTIFNALAQSIEGNEQTRAGELLMASLCFPEWRVDVIKSHSQIFYPGKRQQQPLDHVQPRPMNRHEEKTNAFYLLATRKLNDPGENEATLWETLSTLREIGVPHLYSKPWLRSMIHVAAENQRPETLKAFMRFFPEDVDRPTLHNERPLASAAAVGNMSNVLLLLDAGADPHSRGRAGDNVLDVACHKKHTHIVKALLSRVEYDWNELECAKNWAESPEIEALLDAAKARQAIEQATQTPRLKPL